MGTGNLCRVRQRTLTFALTLMNDPGDAISKRVRMTATSGKPEVE